MNTSPAILILNDDHPADLMFTCWSGRLLCWMFSRLIRDYTPGAFHLRFQVRTYTFGERTSRITPNKMLIFGHDSNPRGSAGVLTRQYGPYEKHGRN